MKYTEPTIRKSVCNHCGHMYGEAKQPEPEKNEESPAMSNLELTREISWLQTQINELQKAMGEWK